MTGLIISASAIGKRVGALEEQLGVRLFHRSTRSVALTAEGALFLKRGRRVLDELEAAQEELSQVNLTPRGRLEVSLPLVADPFLSVMGQFKQAYPDVDLDLEFTDRRVDVIDEGFDAVIRTGDAPDSRLAARRLGSFSMMLVGLARPSCATRYARESQRPDAARLHSVSLPEHRQATSVATRSTRDRGGHSIVDHGRLHNLDARIYFALQGLGIC
jgi:DNA-binding transcriptional LysR family regulator